jgi:DNA-binding CsgD family transcriptional regulator
MRIDALGTAEAFLIVLKETAGPLEDRLLEAVRRWSFTPREREVLRWLVAGDSNKEIALRLGCHEGSVERHVTSLLRKAKCDGRSRLVAWFWTRL